MKRPIKQASKGAEEARQQLPARLAAAAAGQTTMMVLAVTTVTIAEVLTGPLGVGEEGLAKRYRGVL